MSEDAARWGDGDVGIVFSGGGARGMFEVGAYEVLLEHFGRPKVVSGTSAGAINAALVAVGKSPQQMKDFWLSLGRDAPLSSNEAFFRAAAAGVERLADARGFLCGETGRRWLLDGGPLQAIVGLGRDRARYVGRTLAGLAEALMTREYGRVVTFLRDVNSGHVFSSDRLRERLVATLGAEVTPVDGIALAVSVVDARRGRVIRYTTKQTAYTVAKGGAPDGSCDGGATCPHEYDHFPKLPVDVVRASAAIPLLFPAILLPREVPHRDPLVAWDGGVLVNTPLAPAVELGADRIIPILTTHLGAAPVPDTSDLGHVVGSVVDTLLENTYNVDQKLLLARNALARLEHTDRAATRSALRQSAAPPLPLNREVRLFEAIRPTEGAVTETGTYLDFREDTLLAMYEAGRRAARDWYAQGPREPKG